MKKNNSSSNNNNKKSSSGEIEMRFPTTPQQHGNSMPRIQSSMDMLNKHMQSRPCMPSKKEAKENYFISLIKLLEFYVNVFIHSPTYGFVWDVTIFLFTILPSSVTGEMSPYPTVDIVVTMK